MEGGLGKGGGMRSERECSEIVVKECLEWVKGRVWMVSEA